MADEKKQFVSKPFDETKDIELSKEDVVVGKSTFELRVMQYDGGQQKLDLKKVGRKGTGRFSMAELDALIPALNKVRAVMR